MSSSPHSPGPHLGSETRETRVAVIPVKSVIRLHTRIP